MELKDITVEVRDKSLQRIGQIRPEEMDFEVRPMFNNVGDWSVTLPSEHPMVEHLRTPGSGIIIDIRGMVFSGPTRSYVRKASASDPQGMFEFSGLLDDKILGERVAYPQPTNPNVQTQTSTHDRRSGSCEALMHQYVAANMGPGAPTPIPRRDSRLVMGPNLQRGKQITKSARWNILGSLLSEIATLGKLGFRVYQVDNKLQFTTYAVTDRSQEVRLDVHNGTLASDEVTLQAPSATRVIVAGQGELNQRQMIEVTSPASIDSEAIWGERIERFLDQRHTDSWDELADAGEEVLIAEGLQQFAVKAVPTDDGTMRFGIDWFLGDRVTVVVDDQEYNDVVSGAVLKVSESGVLLGVLIGSNDRDGEGLHKLEQRIDYLERNPWGPHGGTDEGGNDEGWDSIVSRVGALETRSSNLESRRGQNGGTAPLNGQGQIPRMYLEQAAPLIQNYVPELTSTGTQPGRGTSNFAGRYWLFGPMVWVEIDFTFYGFNPVKGTGFYSISLPVPPHAVRRQVLTAHASLMGGDFAGTARIEGNSRIERVGVTFDDGYQNMGGQLTYATGNRLTITGMYERDPNWTP